MYVHYPYHAIISWDADERIECERFKKDMFVNLEFVPPQDQDRGLLEVSFWCEARREHLFQLKAAYNKDDVRMSSKKRCLPSFSDDQCSLAIFVCVCVCVTDESDVEQHIPDKPFCSRSQEFPCRQGEGDTVDSGG